MCLEQALLVIQIVKILSDSDVLVAYYLLFKSFVKPFVQRLPELVPHTQQCPLPDVPQRQPLDVFLLYHFDLVRRHDVAVNGVVIWEGLIENVVVLVFPRDPFEVGRFGQLADEAVV